MVRRLAFPAPPPPPWYGLVGVGGGGGWRVRKRAGVVGAATGVVLGGRPGLTRKPFARRIPYNVARALTLTCTLNPTPNPKPRLNAGSKPKAEHTLQILPKPLSTTTPQGEGPHTPPHRGGEAPPYIRTIYLWGGEGGGAAERLTIYED